MSNSEENRYYIYALVDADGVPFYIGKGCGSRVNAHFKEWQAHENTHKYRKIKKVLRNNPDVTPNLIIRKIRSGLSEEDALQTEANLIAAIGLDNLTNVLSGGETPPGSLGEEHPQCKICREEAEWIKWLSINSNRTGPENIKHYNWREVVNQRHYKDIQIGATWTHVEHKKPPFFDKQWDDAKYSAIVEYSMRPDLLQKDVAEKYGFKEHNLNIWRNTNSFGMVDRFKEEYGVTPQEMRRRKNKDKVNSYYRAVEEYLMTNQSQTQVANKYGFIQSHLSYWLCTNAYGLIDRFEREHGVITQYTTT